jgi:hypothetical protein
LLARAILMDRASPVLVKTGADGVPAVVLPVPARANEIVLAYRAAMRSPAQETEARARLGLLLLRLRRFDEVLAILGDHPAHTSDPPLQYVTDFVRGQAFRAKAEFQLAEASYRAAMSDVPGAQSAPVALMTMLATGGRAQDAETLAEAIKDVPQAADPWAAFWYGDHVVLPAVIDSLRRGIQ